MPMRWVAELPPKGQVGRKPAKRPKHYAFAQALRKNPGVWALLGDQEWNSLAGAIRSGKVPAFPTTPEGHYEAAARSLPGSPKNKARIYVRYIPTEVEA